MGKIPVATAFLQCIRGYNLTTFRQDASAGFVVSLLALPLAMALSIAVGLPPQHGIYTAVVAGIAAALLGGSMTQVSGPTAAFVVIVAPVVTQFGAEGLFWCTIMAGFLLLLMGSAGFGRYIHYVPYPVTTGFTAGIAVVIATLALNDFLGLGIEHLGESYIEKVTNISSHLSQTNPYEFSIGLVTLLLILTFGRITRAIPSTIVGIGTGALMAYGFNQYGIEISTIGNHFHYTDGDTIRQGIPPYAPGFHLPALPDYETFRAMLMPAVVIAVLAALESLLSATVADNMAGTQHHPNAELNGIGIANILSGLAGGVPATGAIARTATNIHNGAKTPVSSMVHAGLILLYVLMLTPLINHVSMASLAALLLVTAWRMSHAKQFVRTIKIAPASDSWVLLACFSLTVFVDMIAGVTVGIVLASFLFMKRISELTAFDLSPLPQEAQPEGEMPELPDHVMVYRIDGPLFFGTVEKAFERYRFMHDHIDTLLIDMEHVPLIDMTGLVAMKTMITGVAQEHRRIFLCGSPDITDRIMKKIADAQIKGQVHAVPSLQEGVAHIGMTKND